MHDAIRYCLREISCSAAKEEGSAVAICGRCAFEVLCEFCNIVLVKFTNGIENVLYGKRTYSCVNCDRNPDSYAGLDALSDKIQRSLLARYRQINFLTDSHILQCNRIAVPN